MVSGAAIRQRWKGNALSREMVHEKERHDRKEYEYQDADTVGNQERDHAFERLHQRDVPREIVDDVDVQDFGIPGNWEYQTHIPL